MRILARFLFTFMIVSISVTSSTGQEDLGTQSPPDSNKSESQPALEDQAYLLLDQVIAGIGSLRLPENRSRLEMMAADLLWKRDSERARSLFLQAAAEVVELAQQSAGKGNEPFSRYQSSAELRQKLILTAAQHDAALAYELLRKTQPTKAELAEAGRAEHEGCIEQLLLAEVSQIDPKFALSKAEEMLDRRAYSLAITSTLAQLQKQDERAATQLTEKILGSVRADVLLNSYAAINLTLELLRAGPRTSEATTGSMLQLSVSAYRRLLETAATAALTPSPNTVQGQNASSLKLDQQNARDLLVNLRPLLPQIEQHLPERYQALRQKMSELKNADTGFDRLTYLTQHGTSNNLLTNASTAQPAVRDRLYQQAAFKAVDEGNVNSARQIANDQLDSEMRAAVFGRITAQEQVRKDKTIQLEDLRQTLAQSTSDRDRLRLLLQLARRTKSDNPELSGQQLTGAYALVAGRATNYEQLRDKLQVIGVLGASDPARTFELLQSGIDQLNELISAAATLNGFEVEMFASNEMPLPGNSQLGVIVLQFGQELALLAKSDFRRAVAAAEQVQYPEARLFARLLIVEAALDLNGGDN
ncbi:MAG TPA: hypothetical protein VFR51_13965 [Pyrinomonadaceae bacterium]|nr:hypothetical protein [Pyrinomonadaceae bacterium]